MGNLGDLLRYFYGSPAAIRDSPISETCFATSMAPQLQSATAQSRRPASLLLWLPSCNPRRPILGDLLRYFYGSPGEENDDGERRWRRLTFFFFASGGTTMMTIVFFFWGGVFFGGWGSIEVA